MSGAFFLGIGGWHHDAAAAIVRDGRVVAAAEEERFTRVKHQRGVPHCAIAFCLQKAGVPMRDLGGAGVFFDPLLAAAGAVRRTRHRIGHGAARGVAYLGYEVLEAARFGREARAALRRSPRIGFFPHHLCHAAMALSLSGFPRAAVLSVDEVGESVSAWWAAGDGRELRTAGEVHYPHSLGKIYSAVSQHLGFEELEEFRVMGLAAYGTDALVAPFRRLVRLNPRGFEIDLSNFTFPHRPSHEGMTGERFAAAFGPPRRPEGGITDRHRDLAFAVQAVVEEALLHLARIAHDATGADRLCLAGGVALNCAANGRVAREGPFNEVFVPYAAGDAGTAVGAALLAERATGGRALPDPTLHPFLGPAFDEREVEASLRRAGASYDHPADPAGTIAAAIADGLVVARFDGAMEFGPRALGHRSILADPRRPEMKDVLNRVVKWREPFRPFAPSVPAEDAAAFFDGEPSPYMAVALRVKPAAAAMLPAVTHIDGTARVQAVHREWDPAFHALHHAFAALSHVPVLLNTSFNVKGEPIVCTPDDALRTYFKTGLDALAIGPFWLKKATGGSR